MAEQGKQTQHLMEEVQNLRHLVLSSDRSGIRKEVVPASGTIARQATFPTNNPAPWGLEVRVQWQRPVTCSTTCRCACHHPSRGQGVRRLWPVLGVLFWGYAGLPVMRPGCDDRVCRRPVQGSVTMSYFFPPWLVKQAIALTLRVISSSSIELSLRATRIVDNGALVFKMTHLGVSTRIRRGNSSRELTLDRIVMACVHCSTAVSPRHSTAVTWTDGQPFT